MESTKIFMHIQGLSIILVSYQRTNLLEKALRSLVSAIEMLKSSNYKLPVKIYICINGVDDESLQLLARIKTEFSFLSTYVVSNSRPLSPAAARNQLLQFVKSEFVFFMDDDVCLPKDIFFNFWLLQNQYPHIDVWGGPNLTPLDNTQQQKDCGWLVSQYLIVGPIVKRYVNTGENLAKGGQFNLMLCNLFIRYNVLQSGFEHFFKTAEENELIYRLNNQNCQMQSSSKLFVWHERRKTYKEFITQIFYYGYGRGQLLMRVSLIKQKLFLLAQIIFLIFLLMLFVLPKTIFLMVFVWLFAIQISYLVEFRKLNIKILFLPFLMFLAYTLGLIRGQVQMISHQSKIKTSEVLKI